MNISFVFNLAHRSLLNSVQILAFLLVSKAAAFANSYEATLLHPLSGFTRSAGSGISELSQVGAGFNGGILGSESNALLWNDTPESVTNLHPTGFSDSGARAATQSVQVGYGSGPVTGERTHALLWRGTADSVVDLHPEVFYESQVSGASGDSQVGYGDLNSRDHALLWEGSADSVVDLHPDGFISSLALGVSGAKQSGFGLMQTDEGFENHALLWTGTAESVVDLHPNGFSDTFSRAISGDSQVGDGRGSSTGDETHALLWTGTAESVVDLHPDGFTSSRAIGVAGGLQVGIGSLSSQNGHALLWKGTPESVVDLHLTLVDLPVSFVRSLASDVASDGTIVGTGFTADGRSHAILWTPIPEPRTSLILLFAMAILGSFSYRTAARKAC